MTVETVVQDLIQAFDHSKNSVFVAYGDVIYLPELISEFRTHHSSRSDVLYCPLDMALARRETFPDTLLALFQQFLHWLTFVYRSDADTAQQIRRTFTALQNLKERVKDEHPDEKLSNVINFSDFIFYPDLKNLCPPNFFLELYRFEAVAKWGTKIRSHLLEKLPETLPESTLRFAIFVKSRTRPRLYYGSGEKYASDYITFHEFSALKSHKAKKPDSEFVIEATDSNEFDVFLCHNIIDKPAVREIGRKLKERGLRPWFDEWELRPGLLWQVELAKQIQQIRSAAVFVGGKGFGPWQDMELDAFLRKFVRRGDPVIPVILDDCAKVPELPTFLEGMTWVDFRQAEPDPFERLIWGITGSLFYLDEWAKERKFFNE